ncbi:MAG: LytTR family transcriptional regulator [Bacteroidales bacterium]|nr:LytTR family transcriptional regulator [Bacteroidales bacterium]
MASVIIYTLRICFQCFGDLRDSLFFNFFTLVIGIIPIVIITIINQNIKLAYNLKQASEFNLKIESIKGNIEKEQTVCMFADNDKDMFEIQLSNLLYIEAVGNYVQIYYFIDSELKNVLLRSSLKRLELQLVDFPSLIKCHRAFIVNINQIDKVTGNSQGLKLSLKKRILKFRFHAIIQRI